MKSITSLYGIFAFALIGLAGCADPSDNVPDATVNAPSREGSTTASPAEEANTTTFAFGPESSTISFIGSKVTGSHDGGFRNFAGEFRVAGDRLADQGNKVVIDATSIWSDNDRLTGHLKSADFFDVEQYPTATFISTSVKQANGSATVTGNLTLHGVTQSISFPAQISVSEDQVDVSAEYSLNRFDFGIKYPGKADDLIRKEVVLKLKIRATPGAANFASLSTQTR
jgi:polyisoprenoid-binding protein YceI